MITEMQELILFGGLAKMETLKPIDDGALKTLVNTAPSIGNQSIEIVPKKINQVQAFNQNIYSEYTSYTWNKWIDENENVRYRPIEFDSKTFIGTFIWQTELIKKLVFLSIYTWCKPQDKMAISRDRIFKSIGGENFIPSASIKSSISSYLDAGKRKGFYLKSGEKDKYKFSLSANTETWQSIEKSRRMFIPSDNAINTAKTRAKRYASSINKK